MKGSQLRKGKVKKERKKKGWELLERDRPRLEAAKEQLQLCLNQYGSGSLVGIRTFWKGAMLV